MINKAGIDELDGLYGIGPVLAARIVSFRDENGPFTGPDALAQVDGVSLDLALVLAPHLDWRASFPQEDVNDQRSFFHVVVAWSGVIALCILSFRNVDNLHWVLQSRPVGWRYLAVVQICSLVMKASAGVTTALWSVGMLVRSKRRSLEYERAGNSWAVGTLLCLASVGLANAAAYTFAIPGGWSVFLSAPGEMLILFATLIGIAGLGRTVAVVFRPELAKSRALELLSNAAFVFLIPALALWVWIFRDELPLWVILFTGGWGLLMAWSGVSILRGLSVLQWWQERMHEGPSAAGDNLWLRWINARLPDPDQQKALLKALQRVHPTSRWSTVQGLIVTGAGAWLIAATASAVWEWLVQSWLESGFGAP